MKVENNCEGDILDKVVLIFLSIWCLFFHFTVDAKEYPISLNEKDWQVLKFGKIEANKVEFISKSDSDQIRVSVKKSAGPLVYALPEVQSIKTIKMSGRWLKQKVLEDSAFDEDSVLRIGLVKPGMQTLTGFKKMMAADWIKKLFSLAPKGMGIDSIQFLNLTNRPELLNRKRIHPQSDLLKEKVVWLSEKASELNLSYDLPEPMAVAAIWLSVDGDNTGSEFDLEIERLILITEEKP